MKKLFIITTLIAAPDLTFGAAATNCPSNYTEVNVGTTYVVANGSCPPSGYVEVQGGQAVLPAAGTFNDIGGQNIVVSCSWN